MSIQLGTKMTNVECAEEQLGVRLPSALRSAYTIVNKAIELDLGDTTWTTHPVFDPENAARTANHLVYENASEQRWERFPADAISLGSDGSGNHLVLLVRNGIASESLYMWDHETGELSSTGQDVGAILDAAQAYVARVSKNPERARG